MMGAHTHTMASCHRSIAVDGMDDAPRIAPDSISTVFAILDWQRAYACLQQREDMRIHDDDKVTELFFIERDAAKAARTACEVVGIDWRSLGDMS